MSCSQIVSEFYSDKFRLACLRPEAFGLCRYTCFLGGRSFYFYRVLFASLFLLLLILDFFWIIGFAGAGEAAVASACLDAVQISLVLTSISYCLLTWTVAHWLLLKSQPSTSRTLIYKPGWFFYTISINAIFVCMIIFWIGGGYNSTLEQQLKNTIPGCLILLDLCLSSVPLYLCHAIYVILAYLVYLAVAALGLFLSYTFGPSDKRLIGPSNPTVWVGGIPLLPNGYSDFTNVHRILTVLFGAIVLAIMVHCVLLSVVITRDFFASLFHRSTDQFIDDVVFLDTSGGSSGHQTSSFASSSMDAPSAEDQPKPAVNAAYEVDPAEKH